MAFFKEVLNERGIAGRTKGGNSAWIKRRSFWSRATCYGVNFPVRKTRFHTFFAMLFSPFMLGNMFNVAVRIILVIPETAPQIHDDPFDS